MVTIIYFDPTKPNSATHKTTVSLELFSEVFIYIIKAGLYILRVE